MPVVLTRRILLSREMPDWAADAAPKQKFDRQGVEIPRYASIEEGARRGLEQVASDLQAGNIDQVEFRARGKAVMEQAETEAFVAGRRTRGDLRSDLTPGEEKMLEGRHNRNMEYWEKFGGDIKKGRGRMNYSQRAGMYAESLWSVFTRGESSDWEDPELANSRYHWILDPPAEHCPDCLARAKESRDKGGFTWDELTAKGWPGENTRCLTRCRCHIRVQRKKNVLPERFEEAGPAENGPDGVVVLEQILGGPSMPLSVPAAGLPYAKVDPAVVKAAVAADASEAIAKLLPTLPKALVSPVALHGQGSVRFYVGESGLGATLGRNDRGLWSLIALFLVLELRNPYEKKAS